MRDERRREGRMRRGRRGGERQKERERDKEAEGKGLSRETTQGAAGGHPRERRDGDARTVETGTAAAGGPECVENDVGAQAATGAAAEAETWPEQSWWWPVFWVGLDDEVLYL